MTEADNQLIKNEKRSLNDCWNKIGVMGDHSCPQLKTVIHCHSCPVYSDAGRSLFNLEVPREYLEDWTNLIAETPVNIAGETSHGSLMRTTKSISIMIFRLSGELLAMAVRFLQEVTTPCAIHRLPHRSNQLFLGLVNIRGETLLCISLSHILSLTTTNSSKNTLISSSLGSLNQDLLRRMIVAGTSENRWVFYVDEVLGMYRFYPQELKEAPVVITKAAETYTQGVIDWQDQKVNLLDSELLFYALNRKILEG